MTDLFVDLEGATPLSGGDREGLLRTDIALRGELNLVEAENIAAAQLWAFSRRRSLSRLLSQAQIKVLHRRMFGEVWRWAGKIRTRHTNIGAAPYRIVADLEDLLRDVRAQIADPSRLAWPADEIAMRFHHRLVTIHPFANGNGRHARLAADLLVVGLAGSRFTWGGAGHLTDVSDARTRYLASLRTADRNVDYRPLLRFARS